MENEDDQKYATSYGVGNRVVNDDVAEDERMEYEVNDEHDDIEDKAERKEERERMEECAERNEDYKNKSFSLQLINIGENGNDDEDDKEEGRQ